MAETREPDLIGTSWTKIDAMSKVMGESRYADDLSLPGTLYCKILRSPHPHARITRLDLTPALERPGVLAAISGKDLPIQYGILPVSQDEEALCIDKVRMVGDPVAAVAALEEAAAEAALDDILVEYEPLPAMMSIEEAVAQETVRIHEYGERGNIQKLVSLEFGDVAHGFAQAAHVREDLFYYEGSTHLPLEQHAALAQYDARGRLTLWSSTQTPHYVHRALSKVLELPHSRIRVVAPAVGGGFGGKTDPFSHEIVVCKLAMLAGRPVKVTLTREEVFYAHRGRHPVLMWIKTGMNSEGAITAMHFRSYLDGGAYGSYGVASTYYTGALQTVTYPIDNYKFEGVRVFTNKPPCGPKRGHATPQPRFAVEVQMDKFAEDLRRDPADLRLQHLVRPYSKTVNHLTITTTGLDECIRQVTAASNWKRRAELPPRRGLGLACSAYLTGAGLPIYWNKMPHSGVQIKIDRGGAVTVFCGSTDIGQGSDSVLASIVAEELGLSLDRVIVVTADTDLTPVDLGSYSSRVTLMTGQAAISAAEPLRSMLLSAAAEQLDVSPSRLVMAENRVFAADDPSLGLPFEEAAQLAEASYGTLGSVGSYTPPRRGGSFKGAGVGPSPAYSYSACVAEVACDLDTGQYTVEKIWLAHDVGKAINPMLVIGQVEGSVYMGLGEAMMEEQVFRRGLHKLPSMLDYKSPTALDVPEIESFLIETHDPEGPYGAKEAGQGPLLPVAPAIANAIYDATGVRVDEVPISPEKVLRGLQAKARGRSARIGPTAVPPVAFPEPIRVYPPKEFAAG